MHLTSLAFYSGLVIATASAHISGIDGSSSSSALLHSGNVALQSASIANLSIEKRVEDLIETDEEFDGEEDDSVEEVLEIRGRKHKKETHHRSSKHSGRSQHKKYKQRTSKKKTQKQNNTTSSSVGQKYSGKGTYFTPNQGSCGAWNTESDKIVALSEDIYQSGTHCFRGVEICHGSKCAAAKVADLCPGCHHTSLDMSKSLFKEFAHLDVGVIDIQWYFT
ncbi:uncharacterized protein MEPE_06011 [Melanopsichium pennsylvanicum]|uniref:RlpA-like protein double-psi beta-barrel domain-containing protein n=2 Tax=Melanopsichium pennsylvanicum TaxID=63383 RepID=A0AAJ5C7V1_9BASI|nr:conserved hypothetical protein [Melanopsichium pennsylvanicum 4]SNX87301.1 uncharacterized protein MEPE_06011 [Melanopsichium pennsylvanicum]